MDVILRSLIVGLLLILIFGCGGCVKEVVEPPSGIRDNKVDISSAVEALQAHRRGVRALKASGKLKYIDYYGEKEKEENIDAVLRFVPPRRLFFSARSILGEAVRVGSNPDEFWLHMKPKEISRYWWGRWSQMKDCPAKLLVSPESMLDALGMVKVDRRWLLLSRDEADVLVQFSEDNEYRKKVYVNRAGYLVGKIEYFDKNGDLAVVMELGDYTSVEDAEGSPVPGSIAITSYEAGNVVRKAVIRLKNIKSLDSYKDKLFERPPATQFEHVYVLGDDCQFLEQAVSE